MNDRVLVAPRTSVICGLWVAAIGFFVTRFTVTLAAYDDPTRFLLGGIVPLVLGLVLAAFGVALVVGSFEPRFILTTAAWTTIGAVTMFGLILLTVFGSNPEGIQALAAIRQNTYLANFLIGGSVGGTLTGVYAALNNRYQLRLEQQANRLVVLNRILRDEMLNAVAVIRGNAEQVRAGAEPGSADRALALIEDRSAEIVSTIDEIKYLTQSVDATGTEFSAIPLDQSVSDAVESARSQFPEATFEYDAGDAADVSVWANSRLTFVLENLLENAVVHNDAERPRVDVELEAGEAQACFRITDNGPGLPPAERATLERGEIEDLEDPASGFGLNLVRLLVEQYNGAVETTVSADGTTVEVALARADGRSPPVTNPIDVRSYGVDIDQLGVAIVAAVVAGGLMGLIIQGIAGVVPVIGALYGVKDPVVGWITHEFHSIVFGIIFAGLVATAPTAYKGRLVGRVGIGILWGLFLYFFAAGVVMPLWLRLVGLPAPLPSLTPASFVGHTVWGVVLGVSYHVGLGWLESRQ